MPRRDFIAYAILPIALFLLAFGVRIVFFSGFILSDDSQEMGLFQHVLNNGPDFRDQLHVRFGGWMFNVLAFKWFGVSEFTYFLPTLIMSSSMGVIGYFIFLAMAYRPLQALLGGMFIASAPFEILIGSLRANDLILAWFLALGLLTFVLLEGRPAWQGAILAFLAWIGFYVKIWVVYLFPAMGIYFLIQIMRKRVWQGMAAFSAVTLVFHGATIFYWKIRSGAFFPFLNEQGGTYPVPLEHLSFVLKQYPKMIFQGSEFGTTFFGYLPYLLLTLLFLKLLMSRIPNRWQPIFKMDRYDALFTVYYLSFFLMLNFFSMSFHFDRYYSAHRIFRYLTPLSFPMAIHLAKMVLDILKNVYPLNSRLSRYGVIIAFAPLILINLYQVREATKPGRIYRQSLLSVVKEVKEQSPPLLLTESWLSFFLTNVYLKAELNKIEILTNNAAFRAKDYEKWLWQIQPGLPKGSMLVTGLGSNVYYGGHFDGFRLSQFEKPLDSRWRLVNEFVMLDYLPVPEPSRLWRWTGGVEAAKRPESVAPAVPPAPWDRQAAPKIPSRVLLHSGDAQVMFKEGMRLFDANEYTEAQTYYRKILEQFPGSIQANDAAYFNAVCYFRRQDWKAAVSAFSRLIQEFPESNWVAGAHYHIGYGYKEMKKNDQARSEFQYVLDHFSSDKPLAAMAAEQLQQLPPASRKRSDR